MLGEIVIETAIGLLVMYMAYRTGWQGEVGLLHLSLIHILILAANLVMKGVIYGLKKRRAARHDGEERNGFEPTTI